MKKRFYGDNDFRSNLRLSDKARAFMEVTPSAKIEEIPHLVGDDEDQISYAYTYNIHLEGNIQERDVTAEEVNAWLEGMADEMLTED